MADITLPVNPAELPEDGMDFILNINTGTAALPVWTACWWTKGYFSKANRRIQRYV